MNKMANPKISIITVCLNSEKYIRCTIESVLQQQYPSLEYIIIDGQSTDNTVNIVKEYQVEYPNIITWISEKDNGIYDAMNKGLKLSTGDVIGIINSDDYYEPGVLPVVVEKIQGYDLFHGNLRFSDEEGNIKKIYTHKNKPILKYLSTPFNHPTMFVSRTVYEKLGFFRVKFPTAADYDFMLRFLKSDFKEIYCNKIIVTMRMVGVTSADAATINYEEIRNVFKDNGFSKLLSYILAYFRMVRAMLHRLFTRFPLLIKLFRRLSGYHTGSNSN